MRIRSRATLALFLALGKLAAAPADDSLVRAAAAGDVETVKTLLRGGADPNAGRLYQMPPIAFPLMTNNPAIFDLLADAGADLRELPTPFLAAYADDTDPRVIERFVRTGARIDGKGPKGRSLLSAAINSGNRAMARFAVRAGLSYEPLIREAVTKALPLIQSSAAQFSRATGCASCHHAALPVMAVSAARDAGIPINENLYTESREVLLRPYSTRIEQLSVGSAAIADADTGVPFAIIAAAAAAQKANATLEAMVHYMARLQHPNGAWGTGAYRPPIEGSAFTSTALNLRAAQLYGGSPEQISRAKEWLVRSGPQSTQDRGMQIFGFVWAQVDRQRMEVATAELLRAQRPEGGWAETATLDSDAYSTGEAMVALRAAGALNTSDEPWLRAVDYLLRTQQDDGSWFVRSRSVPVQPFVDSGFPHGRHQFISAAGTNWATMALIEMQ